MRTKEAITVVCDGCGKTGTGAREERGLATPQGQVTAQRIVAPQGWETAVITPDVAVPARREVDPFLPAPELARLLGGPVEAAFCGRCRLGLRRRRILGEERGGEVVSEPHEAATIEASAADEERARVEREAEAADRARFEMKRAAEATAALHEDAGLAWSDTARAAAQEGEVL